MFNDRYKFKAQELNRKIIEGAEVLKKPAVKEPTVPEGFDLQIEKRLQERQACKPQEEQEKLQIFKSHPLPKKILEGVVVSLNSANSSPSNMRVHIVWYLLVSDNMHI